METTRYHRKVIRITALDSPNVQAGLAEVKAGLKPTGKMLVPGVMPYEVFAERLANWDDEKKDIGLWAKFYRGPQQMLFPSSTLNQAIERAHALLRTRRRYAKGIGIDTADGGDSTVWSATDELGLLDQLSMKTRNTATIPRTTIAFARKWGLEDEPWRWTFDQGGGGHNHACVLREMGYDVRTTAFGGSPLPMPVDEERQRYKYKTRRAQLYGQASLLLEGGYAIPAEMKELLRQLSKIPRLLSTEGELTMLPKRVGKGSKHAKSLVQILGCSPDEADSWVLSVESMLWGDAAPTAGAEVFDLEDSEA